MLVAGSTFASRYIVQRPLGEGGMGAVFAVEDTTAGEPVALKLLFDKDPEAVERFRRELRVARRISHPNVARVHDIGEADGRLFLTMELLAGESLRDMLDRCRALPLDWVHWVGRQVAAGLMAAHHVGVVHRDLKAENVIVCRDGRVVLIDFGIARALEAPAITGTGQIIGTADCMAPEQLEQGGVIGPHTDVYALSLLLFEALTGQRAFAGDNPVARAVARLREAPHDVHALAPETPAALASLVRRGLSRTPALRPQMAELSAYFVGVVDRGAPAPAPAAAAPLPIDFGQGGDPLVARVVSTIGPRRRVLSVAPFDVRSDVRDEHELGIGIAEELFDVLSMTKGLELRHRTASGALEPDVDTVVRGTVTLSGDSVRIAARLLEPGTGKQLWSERFEGARGDVLQLQVSMAQRIAEALRLELQTIAYRDVAPDAAVEAYLRARRILRVPGYLAHEALALCDEALRLHPGFPLALATRAMALSRSWNLPTTPSLTMDFATEAPRAAAVAMQLAAGSPDAHLASAFVAVQQARFTDAIEAFRAALSMAPTHGAAHEYLGRIQIEAGRPAEGIRSLAYAAELDPSFLPSLAAAARCYAQRGRYADADRALARARTNLDAIEGMIVELRIANWTDDRTRAWQVMSRLPDVDEPIVHWARLFARLITREPVLALMEQTLDAFLLLSSSPRWRALVLQIAFEIEAGRDTDRARKRLASLADAAFIDLEWLEHCPALDDYKDDGAYRALHKATRSRVKAAWGRTIS